MNDFSTGLDVFMLFVGIGLLAYVLTALLVPKTISVRKGQNDRSRIGK